MTHWKCFPDSGATNAGGSPVRPPQLPGCSPIRSGFPAEAGSHTPDSCSAGARPRLRTGRQLREPAIAPSDDEAEPLPINRSPARPRATASCRLAKAPVLRQGAESRKGGLRLGRSSRHDGDYGMDERYATPLQPMCSIVDDVSDQGRTRRLRSCGVWPCSIISADNPMLPTRPVNPRTQIGDHE